MKQPQSPPLLIIGLGNPGTEHSNQRHNAGFWWLDALLEMLPDLNTGIEIDKLFQPEKKFKAEQASIRYKGQIIRLLKPETYMNLSGESVVSALNFYKLKSEQVLVIHDELDIPNGQIKFKFAGGNGGHNGLKSISQCLGTPNYWRLRIGIGRPNNSGDVSSYVLNRPTSEQERNILDSIALSLKQLPTILSGKYSETMNSLHTNTKTPISDGSQ